MLHFYFITYFPCRSDWGRVYVDTRINKVKKLNIINTDTFEKSAFIFKLSK